MVEWFFVLLLVGSEEKVIRAPKTEIPPRIDGFIETVWAKGDSAKNFILSWPDEDKPASESTIVYLLSDSKNLYVAFRCYDEPNRINAWVTPRDEGFGDDVGFIIAPFGDRVTGYKFLVNARNVQTDMIMTNDGRDSDSGWDGVWESQAQITDFGYVVEMKIPFNSKPEGSI